MSLLRMGWIKIGFGLQDHSVARAGSSLDAIAPGKLLIDLDHLLIEVLEALRHRSKAVCLLLRIYQSAMGHELAVCKQDADNGSRMADKTFLAEG
jgi:hypothetical protein